MTAAEPPAPHELPAASGFRLVSLGAASLEGPGGAPVLGPGIPLAILTYLHTCRRRAASREHLADVFWPDSDSALGRQALRQNLTRLRDILGRGAFDAHGEEVRLVADLQSDRESFLDAVNQGDFPAAMGQYAGPFFPGHPGVKSNDFEHWLDRERERLRNLYFRAGEAVVRQALDRGRPTDALEVAARLHAEAPDSERMHRLLVEVALAAHAAGQAREEAAALIHWLKREGRPPDPATARVLQLALEGAESGVGVDPEELLPELVGREREFQSVISEWRVAAAGSARAIHLEGQAGFGKTRLLQEVGKRIEALSGRVAYACARPGERQSRFAFLADFAAAVCALPGAKGVSSQTAGILVSVNPTLGALYTSLDVASPGGQDLTREVLALCELVTSVAEEAPLALLADDTQWIDGDSRRVLSGVIARLGPAKVLWVSAGRPTSIGLFPGTKLHRLLLTPLNLAETEAFLGSLGRFSDDSVRRRLAAALYKASSGSPLLLLETIRHALDAGRVRRRNGAWAVSDLDGLIEWLGERDALEARLSSLSPPARKFLLTLAATGTSLARDEIEEAVQSGVISPDTLIELEFRGYIASRGKQVNLAHDTIGELVVRLAGEAERKAVHAALGRAQVSRGFESPVLARRAARHLAEAGAEHDLARLFRQWVGAAQAAGDPSSPDQLARELLQELADPDRVSRLVSGLATRETGPSRSRTLLVATGVGLAVLAALLYWIFSSPQ